MQGSGQRSVSVRTARCCQPLQPLLAGFFFSSSVSSGAASFAFSSALFLTSSPAFSVACCWSALTAPALLAPQPLAAAGLVTSALPVLGFAPQPLPAAWDPGKTPPALIKLATPKLASNFFTSFFITVSLCKSL
jgi:hypothetical protein